MKKSILILLVAMAACQSNEKTPEQQAVVADTVAKETAQAPALDSAYLVLPGVAIGNTKINENMDDVIRLLGKPDDGDAAMQKAVAIYYKDDYATSILSARDTGDNPVARVKQIRVTSPAFKTGDDLHVGTVLQTGALKKVTTYKTKNTVFTVWDRGDGLAFEADSTGKCVAVLVYAPEEPYKGAYLNIRPNR